MLLGLLKKKNSAEFLVKKGTREMNANELADWIENGAPFGKYETAKQAVVMLRQQQAEIEVLKARCDSLKEANDGFARHLIINPEKELSLSDTLVEKELLTDDELKAFLRFCECVEDGEEYDVPKEMMIRLSCIGVIKPLPRDWYENTEFGNYIIEKASEK